MLENDTHGLGAPADGVGLPLGVGAGGVGLVEVGRAVVVEAGEQARDAKGTATRGLSVLLLHA